MLNGNSQGVVHSTPTRTRLRIPADYRDRDEMRKLEHRIQEVPGVKYCETNEHSGSITIFHETDPDILEHIGQAIKGLDLKLFTLLAEERLTATKGLPTFSDLFSKVKESTDRTIDSKTVDEAKDLLKKGLPIAFVAAGIATLVEAESVLAGVAPIVLFYYAFDLYWKFKHDREATKTAKESG